MEKDTYYSKPGLSNSAFTALNPEQGGSQTKYLKFIEGDDERVESNSMERGTIVHTYIEDPENFSILEIDRPADKLGDVASECINAVKHRMAEGVNLENINLDQYVINSCKVVGWNPKWGDEALLKNAGVIKPYVLQMLQAESSGKITIDKKGKEVITNCARSLERHKIAASLLFTNYKPEDQVTVFKELDIYWEIPYIKGDGTEGTIACKAMIDNVIVDGLMKRITINDLKTGAFNIGNFDGTFKYKRVHRQLAWYKRAFTEYCIQNKVNIDNFEWCFNVIAVETKDEFRTAVFPVNDLWIMKGKEEYDSLINRLVFHLNNGFDQSMEEYNNGGYMLLKNPE